MVTKNKTDNKSTSSMTLAVSVLLILAVSNVFGFLAWACWQVAASNSELIPTMSLVAGLALWNAWTFVICVPLAFKVMFASGIQADIDARYAENMKKVYSTLPKTYANIPPNYYDTTANKNDKLDS